MIRLRDHWVRVTMPVLNQLQNVRPLVFNRVRYNSAQRRVFQLLKNECSFSYQVQLIIDLSKRLSKNPTNNCFRTFPFVVNIHQSKWIHYFRRRHCLTISAPAIPLPPTAPHPGPGAYDVRDFKEAEKKYMSSAAFVSSTSRWVIDTTAASEQPGPSSYTPRAPMKQSFNFNFERKWLW